MERFHFPIDSETLVEYSLKLRFLDYTISPKMFAS